MSTVFAPFMNIANHKWCKNCTHCCGIPFKYDALPPNGVYKLAKRINAKNYYYARIINGKLFSLDHKEILDYQQYFGYNWLRIDRICYPLAK